mgnify:CR=1 FL=1
MIQTASYSEMNTQLFQLYSLATTGKASKEDIWSKFNTLSADTPQAKNTGQQDLLKRYRALIDLALRGTAQEGPDFRKPIVITSINPYSRADLQIRCFRKWQKLGFNTFTCNHGSEIKALLKGGVPQDSIIQLGEEETGKALHGKHTPKILAVLGRAAAMFDSDVLLVNADLYPASEGTGFLSIWRQTGDMLALTREEVFSLDFPIDRACKPYRGGLDAFLLPQASVGKLLKELSLFPVSNRMCFGIVGWDYFVGAFIERRLGATFIDSHVLFHETHRPTYNNVAEFSHYLPALQALGIGLGKNHEQAVQEFSGIIESACQKNLSAQHVDDLRPSKIVQAAALNEQQQQVLNDLSRRMPNLVHAFGSDFVSRLIGGIASRQEIGFPGLIEHFRDSEYKRSFSQILLTLVLLLHLRGAKGLTTEYPKGNMHAAAMRIIRDNSKDNPDLRRIEIAKIFCTELADYKIVNKRLFNALVLSCESDAERALMMEIRNFMTGKNEDAA